MSNEPISLSKREDHAQMKYRLLWRMGVAGLMIFVLLGGLAWFDYLTVEPDEPESAPQRFTEPVPVSQKPMTQALGPVVPAPPEETDEEEETTKADQAVPEASAAPEGPVVAEDAPPLPPKTVARPSVRKTPPPSTTTSSPSPRPEARKSPSRPEIPGTRAAPTSAAGTVPTIPQSTPVLTRLLSGYTLQAGVFTDPRRAEEIYTRLTQEGIPVTLETRVLVGPFKSRKEAESAHAKIKAMGIEALPVAQGRKK